ncbi:MAG TPA: S9 family peptidase [Chloroflexota bacterium]|nr:S9 family peptidase [Chloroflexota bacterium]
MAKPLSPETLIYELVTNGDPQISPDGTRVVYSRSVPNTETKKTASQVWCCDVAGENARQLTGSGERNRGARWSPDSRRIAFVSDRVKKSGIFVLPMDGNGEAREITRHNVEIGELAWAPDGRTIAYVVTVDPENPNEEDLKEEAAPRVRATRRIDYKQDGRGYLGDARRQVVLVDVTSGERRQLTTSLFDHAFPEWSSDGQTIAVQVSYRNGMCSRLALVSVASGERREIGAEEGIVSTWAWSPRGDRIILTGDTTNTWQTDFFLYEVASGELRRLTDDLPCLPIGGAPGVSAPMQPVWLDDHRVLFAAARAGAAGLYVLDAATARQEEIHRGESLKAGMSVDAARRYIVQGSVSPAGPGEITVFDWNAGTERPITASNAAALSESPPAQWERLDVRRGEFTIEAWLLKPADFDPTKRYPVVLDVHGGPNGFYGYGFSSVQQCLATNGFLVVYANPRGSSSYGRHFTQQVCGDWGGEDYRDLMAVVDAVLERPYADPERTGIYGYSYGGYMTSWTIGQTDRFKAAVCGAPCFDLAAMYGTSDISHQFGELQWGGPPHERPSWYVEHSPSTYAHRATTPTLIVHGEADERCPIGQGEEMFVALKKAGCEVEFVRYPGGSHSFINTGPLEHRHDFLSRVLGWFEGHLEAGGR